MIVYGAFILAILTTLVFYILKPREYKWWEFIIPPVISLGLIFGSKAIIDSSAVRFTEYWGETITSVYEEEPYNYWKSEMCSREVACGTDSEGNTEYCTEWYDCSHQEDVGPSWWCKTNIENSYRLSEHLYDSLLIVFGNRKNIIDSHQNYDPRDRAVSSRGTKFDGKSVGNISYVYQGIWPGTDLTRKGIFTKHTYENRIRASDLSLFNISVVTEEEADSIGLYNYPEDIDMFDCPVILGGKISPETQENFRKLNAKFGPSNKLRLWILIFDNKPASIAAYQENYWVKGNKNELVICIGTKGEEITWVHSFSWALSGELTTEVTQKALDLYIISIETTKGQNLPIAIPLNTKMKEIVSQGTGIDTVLLPPALPINLQKADITKVTKSKTPVLTEQTWKAYYDYLNNNLQRFEKRSFEEFSYIKVEPKNWQVILIYIISLLVSAGLNIWTSNNEFNDAY